jgi:parallel beta-helix repeat protein
MRASLRLGVLVTCLAPPLLLFAACGGDDSSSGPPADAAPNDGTTGNDTSRPDASGDAGTDSSGDASGDGDASTDADATRCSDGSPGADGGVPLAPGANLTTAIASNPAGTRFLLACGTYRFATDNSDHKPLYPKTGDEFIGAGNVCGVPTAEPCARLSGAIRIPTDSPDNAWHPSNGLWFNAVGANNVLPAPTGNTALCYLRNGGGACTTATAFGACVYGQDLFYDSLPKPRLTAGDDGSVDQWPPPAGFWYFDITGRHGSPNTVWVADDPTAATVELSVVDGAFWTNLRTQLNPNVVIQNLTIDKFAGVYGTGAIWAYGDNWQILNNWVEHNHYGGVLANGSDGIRPTNWLVQNNELYENGNGGAGGPTMSSTFSNNEFDRNGYANYCNDSGQKWEGTSPVISDNTVNHTNGVGLWFDSFTQGGTFTGNTVVGGLGEGIRCEISHACSITKNTVTNNEQVSNALCVAPHVPWPIGNDCCTGPQQGTCPTACAPGSVAPSEIAVAQSDNSTVGGMGNGNIVTTSCGGIAVSTGTRDTVPNTGNSVTYNSVTYAGAAATVPHAYGYHVGAGGVVPAANTFDYNDWHFVDAGAGALTGNNWQTAAGYVPFAQWQAVPQDQHGQATSP